MGLARDSQETLELARLARTDPGRVVEEVFGRPQAEAIKLLHEVALGLDATGVGCALDRIGELPEPSFRAQALAALGPWLPVDEATQQRVRAIRMGELDALGADNPSRPTVLLALARLARSQHDFEGARVLLESAADAPDERLRRDVLDLLGSVALWMRDVDRAERALRAALVLTKRLDGPGTQAALQAANRLALALANQGALEEARALQEQAAHAGRPPRATLRRGAPEFPCPCCGYLVFDEPAGSYAICPICTWEDDVSQLRFPRLPGGPNKVSLIAAQTNFPRYGTSDPRVSLGRAPTAADSRDAGWRPIDETVEDVEHPVPGVEYGETYPDDPAALYYWRRTFWRSNAGGGGLSPGAGPPSG